MSNRQQGDDLDRIQDRLNKARRNRATGAAQDYSSVTSRIRPSAGSTVASGSSASAAATTQSAPAGTWENVNIVSPGGRKKMVSPLAGLRKGLSSTRGAFSKAASSRRIVAQDQSINLRNQENFASPIDDPSNQRTAMSRLGHQASNRSLMSPPFADEFNDAAPNVESEEYLDSDMKNRNRLSPMLASVLSALIDCYTSIAYHADRLYLNCARGGGRDKCVKILIAAALLAGGAFGIMSLSGGPGSSAGIPMVGGRAGAIMQLLVDAGVTPADKLNDRDSIQHAALDWIANQDPAKLPTDHSALKERYILAVFFYGSNPSEWSRNDRWMTGAGHCSWYGIECVPRDDETQESGIARVYDDNDAITSIMCPGNNISGPIPIEFGKLPNMLTLDLGNNDITGELPPLNDNLKYLLIPGNQIEGSFPKHFQYLTNLHGLDLSNNKMAKFIPNNINKLTTMRTLLLSDNQFTGLFPDIKDLSEITKLHLQNNGFNGPIPGILRDYERLEILRLDNNTFTGQFPKQSIERLRRLEYLDLSSNDMTGAIPDIFDSIHRLTVLHLQHNRFRSTIPSSIMHLSGLKSLRLDHNVMTGKIPDSISVMADVEHVALNNNHLTGEIPTYIGFVDDIAYLSLKNNRFDGTIPTEIASLFRLTHLELEGNQLTGGIPSELGSLSALGKLSLYENSMNGVTMPIQICDKIRRGEMEQLTADCTDNKVTCDCCTKCYP